MENRLKKAGQELAKMSVYAPMEIFIGVTFFILWIIYQNIDEGYSYDSVLALCPQFFVLTFICNKLFQNGLGRIIYYLSGFLLFMFVMANVDAFVHSAGYWFSLLIAFLVLISYGWYRDNERFAAHAVRVLLNIFSAVFIAYALCLAVVAIYASIIYIFSIDFLKDFDFYSYILSFSNFVSLPLAFVYFDKKEQEPDFHSSRVFDILMNFIFSPAIIVYTVILYIYFAKIAVLWELPKGQVAYMVFAFVLSVVIGKACQPLLYRRFYDWFYRYASFISLPLFVMFWVGVGYRINEYGFTEERVYLVLLGGLTTFCMLFFLTKVLGKYLYIALIAIFVLSIFTFIPAVSAKRIGLVSQTKRLDKVIEKLGIADSSGLLHRIHADNDTVYKKEYKELYGAFRYVAGQRSEAYMMAHYGVDGAFDLRKKIIPGRLDNYVTWGGEIDSQSEERFITFGAWADIEGFTGLYDLDVSPEYSNGDYKATKRMYTFRFKNGTLTLKDTLGNMAVQDMNQYVNGILRGMKSLGDMPDSCRERLHYVDTDLGRIVFSSLTLSGDSIYKVDYLRADYLLTK